MIRRLSKMDDEDKSSDRGVGSKLQVKDLLTHMDPMIYLAGTADNTSEMLACLAGMDPAFHKLELVKNIRKIMREELSKVIEGHVDGYLEAQKGKMRSENPVDFLVDKMNSEDSFRDFVNASKASLKNSVEEISSHFDDEIVTGMFASEEDELNYNFSPNNSNESSLNSSLNQSGLLFLHPAQYSNIGKSLLNKKDMNALNDSLDILLAVTPGEVVMQDCWIDVRKGLKECLYEDSMTIVDKSLKIHSKILTSQVHNAVKEAYLNLIEALAGFYISKRLIPKVPVKGEDVDLKKCESIVRILKVLIDFQKELPLLWVRYPERFIDDIVESTFSLLALSLSSKDNTVMTVLDMLSIVDPTALWLKRWTHGQWGRIKTFAAIKSNLRVLLHSVSFCVQYLENVPHDPEVNNGNLISFEAVNRLRFSHCLHFIMIVLNYSDGRRLFPVNVPSKDELVTIQAIIQILIRAVNINVPKMIIVEISNALKNFCSQDEIKCWILCDAGIVESLLNEISKLEIFSEKMKSQKVSSDAELPCVFIESLLGLLDSILSTQMGRKYILLGRKRKTSSKSGLSGVTNSPACQVMDLILNVLRCRTFGSDLRKLGIEVCSTLLASPIGMHLCLEHELIKCFVENLKIKIRPISPQKLPRAEATNKYEPLQLSVSQSLPLLTTLLLSYKGIFLLENEGVLPSVLQHVLPEMMRKGSLSAKILAHVCSSAQGCSVVGTLKIMQPFWDSLCNTIQQEDEVQQRWLEEEQEAAVAAAMAPLTAVTATCRGTQLLFSEQGLQKDITKPLFFANEILSNVHPIALKLLASATSVMDSASFLQASYGYQEHLLMQQQYMRTGDGESVITDENSVLRNHILVKSYLIGGSGERWLPPLTIDDTSTSTLPPLFDRYPPPREYIPEKPIRSMHKKQNDVWRFLTDTRHGLHDMGWLNHCRKAVRGVLSSGEDIKSWLVMDIIERAVRALLSSTEELLPGSPVSVASPTSPTTSIPPTLSLSPGANNPTISPLSGLPDKNSDSPQISETHLIALEMVLRYGSELQLLTGSGSLRENMIDILKFTQVSLGISSAHTCDWFTMVMFLLCGGNVERCRSVLQNLSGLVLGGILWPSYSDSLTDSHTLLPGELTLAGIVHNVQLLLSIEIPTLFLSMQASDTSLWSVVGEWVRCVYVGVLPWVEVCHYLILVLLQGPDYSVYFVVALLRHVQASFTKHAGRHNSLIDLQTMVIHGWHAGEHLNFMEALSRRHRRTVLPALITPLYDVRDQYTPTQL